MLARVPHSERAEQLAGEIHWPSARPGAEPNQIRIKLKHHSQHRQVQIINPNQTISDHLYRSEISNLQTKYDDQLADWKKKCDDKDKEIAALKAEITKLKAEIKRLKER